MSVIKEHYEELTPEQQEFVDSLSDTQLRAIEVGFSTIKPILMLIMNVLTPEQRAMLKSITLNAGSGS
jgi:hypothetical protein